VNPDDNLRLFLAFDPGAEVRSRISAVYSDRWLQANGIRCVDPANIHMTVLFLGSIPAKLVDPLKNICDSLCKSAAPLRLTISGVGYYGHRGKPRVLWAGAIGDTAPLAAMKESLLKELPDIGIVIAEDHPFSAHLTFARIKEPVKGVDEFCERHKGDVFGEITIDRLKLYRSTLSASGAVYTVIHESVMLGTWHRAWSKRSPPATLCVALRAGKR